MADIHRRPSNLLSGMVGRIRKTDEDLARISVIDVAVAMSGHGADYASQAVVNIGKSNAAVLKTITDCKWGRPSPGASTPDNARGC